MSSPTIYNMIFFVAFVLLSMISEHGMARVVFKDVTVVSGTLYAFEPTNRENMRRITRRHLQNMPATRIKALRLDLGPDMSSLDMELSEDSAWTEGSQVFVRSGDDVEEVLAAVDRNCYLSGQLTSQDGAATLNRCGRLSGLIQTDDFSYEIEETGDENLNRDFPNVKVTIRRSFDVNPHEQGIIIDDTLLAQEQDVHEDNNDLTRNDLSKRQNKPVVAEVAVFLDANFINHLSRVKRLTTVGAMTDWVVKKWNVIKKVYGNERDAGVPFDVQLKRVEFWQQNPSYYQRVAASGADTNHVLNAFCRGSPNNPNYDHKMLYTQGTGGSHMGMAYVNGICRPITKCSLVKAKEKHVTFELHEFGHNMGLEHDPDLGPCTDPSGEGGFMGWSFNNKWLDCYRRDMLKHLREPGARCLYQKNVDLPVLNSNSEPQIGDNDKKKGSNRRRKNRRKGRKNRRKN